MNVDDKSVFRGLMVNSKAFCRVCSVIHKRSPVFCVHAMNEYAVFSVNVNSVHVDACKPNTDLPTVKAEICRSNK